MLVNGPLNKSLFTQEFELIVKTLLEKPEGASIVNEENSLHFKIQEENVDINLTTLLKKIDFSHLYFNEADSEKYLTFYPCNMSDELIESKNNLLENIEHFSEAEFCAITGYVNNDYYSINNMLHEKLTVDNNIFAEFTNQDFTEAILNAAFIASGLNKLPVELNDLDLYRGDKPTEAMIQERIAIVQAGGGMTDFPAFMSTSSDKSVAYGFGLNHIAEEHYVVHFNKPYGKDLSLLGVDGEAEYLINPSTILWTGYEMVEHTTIEKDYLLGENSEIIYIDEIITRPMHIFHAEIVAPLNHGEDNFNRLELDTFAELKNWADNAGIQTDFITPYITAHLQHPALELNTLPEC